MTWPVAAASWGPRTAKGSGYVPFANASAVGWSMSCGSKESRSGKCSLRALRELFGQGRQTAERCPDPVGAICNLVGDLERGLFHHEEAKQVELCIAQWATCPFAITFQQRDLCKKAKPREKRVRTRRSFLARMLKRALDGRRGRVEGTDHASHIAQRTRLGTTLRERLRGLAFEVDERNIATRHEHLAQMHVAMDTRREGSFRLCSEALDPREGLRSARLEC